MKLWMLENPDCSKTDRYILAVVAAPDEESARKIHPSEEERDKGWSGEKTCEWCSSSDVEVTYISETGRHLSGDIVYIEYYVVGEDSD